MEYTLSLCDIYPLIRKDCADARHFLQMCERKSGFSFSRIHLGGSFCGRAFLADVEDAFRRFAPVCREMRLSITLTIPLFTEQELTAGKQVIHRLLAQYGQSIDEVTVNDGGMYRFVSEIWNIPINTGRLMHKQLRDPRYPEHEQELTVVSPDFFPAAGMELDAVTRRIQIDGFSGVIAIHTPYTYWTTGKLCHISGMGADVYMKFNPNHRCGVDCGKMFFKYESRGGNLFYQVGNTVYYKTTLPEIASAAKLRVIWTPLEFWEESHEYSGSHQ